MEQACGQLRAIWGSIWEHLGVLVSIEQVFRFNVEPSGQGKSAENIGGLFKIELFKISVRLQSDFYLNAAGIPPARFEEVEGSKGLVGLKEPWDPGVDGVENWISTPLAPRNQPQTTQS